MENGNARRAELLLGYSASQNLDLFDPEARTALIVIDADRRLRQTIRLDGLTPLETRP
jgi:hypothetical protein